VTQAKTGRKATYLLRQTLSHVTDDPAQSTHLWYVSRKSIHKGILHRTLLLLCTFSEKYRKLITWSDISNTRWYYTYHCTHTWKKR